MIAVSVALAVLLSVVLASMKFERTLREVTGARLTVVADGLRRQVEYGLALGLDLAELADVQAQVDRTARGANIEDVQVVDEGGTILFADDHAAIGQRVRQSGADEPPNLQATGDALLLGSSVRNSFGQTVGMLTIRASLEDVRGHVDREKRALLPDTMAVVAAAGLVTLAAVFVIIGATFRDGAPAQSAADPIRRLVVRLAVVSVVVLLIAAGAACWLSLRSFAAVLQPELTRTAETIGGQLAAQVDHALAHGIPLDRLPGLQALFEEEGGRHGGIAYIAMSDAAGRVTVASGATLRAGGRVVGGRGDRTVADRLVPGVVDTALPLGGDAAPAGWLHVGMDAAFLAKSSTGLALDVLSVVLVAVLLVFELLLLEVHLAAGRLSAVPRPAQEPAKVNLTLLRMPVFLFCLSEELSRPFLPAYAASFAPTAPWLSPDLVVSLPITLFMLVWALSQPGGVRVSERWGRPRAFLAGALLGSASLAMTAFVTSLYGLLLWRCLAALGYGLVLITAQGVVVDHTTPQNRAAGMAMFIGALLAAGVCGPVAGGIIADHAGFRASLLVGAALALGAGIAVTALLPAGGAPPAPSTILAWGAIRPLMRNARFASLMMLSAIPTKVAATGFLLCLLPLLLTAEGASKAEVGRAQMLYFFAFILVSPLAASLSDRLQARRGFIALGGIGTLLSCLPLLAAPSWWGAPLAIASFGLSQALIGAPQLTLVSQIAGSGGLPETAAIGWYRLFERLGGALGPIVAVSLAMVSSYREAMLGIGLLCGASAVVFWLLHRTAPSLPATPCKQET